MHTASNPAPDPYRSEWLAILATVKYHQWCGGRSGKPGTHEHACERVAVAFGPTVSASDVRQLVDGFYRELGKSLLEEAYRCKPLRIAKDMVSALKIVDEWLVEGEFVKANLSRAAVADGVGAFEPCNCTIEGRTQLLLHASLAQVEALYRIEKEGGFKKGDPRGIAFASERLAAGATAVRDMIVEAWLDSANTPVGYPMVNVRDIESGKVRVTRALFGAD